MSEPEERPYDWKPGTFCLSVADVARMLDTTPQTVVDLMLTRKIGFYMAADPDREDGLPIDSAQFDPEDVTDFLRRDHDRHAAIALPVLANLRKYLREVPRTRDYATAVSQGRPIQTRAGLHVQTMAVVNFARRTSPSAAAKMKNSTEVAFQRLGLLRVRSMTPYGDRQRWAVWYRLPEALAFEGVSVKIDSFLRHNGTMAMTEQLVQAGDGSGPVVGQPIHEGS